MLDSKAPFYDDLLLSDEYELDVFAYRISFLFDTGFGVGYCILICNVMILTARRFIFSSSGVCDRDRDRGRMFDLGDFDD